MKKRISIIIFALICALLLCACGESADFIPSNPAYDAETLVNSSATDRKVIYTLDASYKVDDISAAISTIKSKMNGDEWSDNESISDNYAYLQLRIKSDRLDEFIDSVSTVGSRTSYNKTSQDVTSYYNNLQAEIEALEATDNRLNELKETVTNYVELMEIAERQSEIEQKIKEYRKALGQYDAQIDYSFVIIRLNKNDKAEKQGFGTRLGNAFKNGWKGFLAVMEFILIALSYIIVFLAIPAVIALVIFLIIYFYRKKHPPKEKTKIRYKYNYNIEKQSNSAEQNNSDRNPKDIK